MDSQKRLILALGLCFLLTVVWSFFFRPQPPVVDAVDAGSELAAVPPPPSASADGGLAAAVPLPDGGVGAAVAAGAPVELPPLRELEVKRDVANYKFSTAGGGLTGAPLHGEKMREQPKVGLREGFSLLTGGGRPDSPPMDMAVPASVAALPLSVGITGERPMSTRTRYAVEEADGKLTFTGSENGWEVTKVVTFPKEGYELRYDVTVKNAGAAPAAAELALHYGRAVAAGSEEKGSIFGSVGNLSRAACMVGDKFEHLVPGSTVAEQKGPVHFFGVDQQYFLGAVFPLSALDGRCAMVATETAREAVAYFPLQLMPGQAVTRSFGVYIGPKDVELLRTVGLKAVGEQGNSDWKPLLDKTVDFGFWAVICNLLLTILKFFHGITGNWGVAIILLTLTVRMAMVPLAHKSMMSAEAMKKLQPKMEELKKKYPDDKQKQNEEMMKLYQEAKVNPLGGCLPLLIQMPIWIALFTTLRTSFELYREPFFGPLWFDLTYKDPIYFLPLALGVTQIVTMKLQPQMTMDQTQARMMTFVMPVMFTLFMLNYPSGLTLYIFTSNLFQILQQYTLRKYIERKGAAAAPVTPVARRNR